MTTGSNKTNPASATEDAASRKPWSAPRVIESTRAKNSAGGTFGPVHYDAHVPATTLAFS